MKKFFWLVGVVCLLQSSTSIMGMATRGKILPRQPKQKQASRLVRVESKKRIAEQEELKTQAGGEYQLKLCKFLKTSIVIDKSLVAVSRNNIMAVVGDDIQKKNNALRVYDLAKDNLKPFCMRNIAKDPVCKIVISADGNVIVMAIQHGATSEYPEGSFELARIDLRREDKERADSVKTFSGKFLDCALTKDGNRLALLRQIVAGESDSRTGSALYLSDSLSTLGFFIFQEEGGRPQGPRKIAINNTGTCIAIAGYSALIMHYITDRIDQGYASHKLFQTNSEAMLDVEFIEDDIAAVLSYHDDIGRSVNFYLSRCDLRNRFVGEKVKLEATNFDEHVNGCFSVTTAGLGIYHKLEAWDCFSGKKFVAKLLGDYPQGYTRLEGGNKMLRLFDGRLVKLVKESRGTGYGLMFFELKNAVASSGAAAPVLPGQVETTATPSSSPTPGASARAGDSKLEREIKELAAVADSVDASRQSTRRDSDSSSARKGLSTIDESGESQIREEASAAKPSEREQCEKEEASRPSSEKKPNFLVKHKKKIALAVVAVVVISGAFAAGMHYAKKHKLYDKLQAFLQAIKVKNVRPVGN